MVVRFNACVIIIVQMLICDWTSMSGRDKFVVSMLFGGGVGDGEGHEVEGNKAREREVGTRGESRGYQGDNG